MEVEAREASVVEKGKGCIMVLKERAWNSLVESDTWFGLAGDVEAVPNSTWPFLLPSPYQHTPSD